MVPSSSTTRRRDSVLLRAWPEMPRAFWLERRRWAGLGDEPTSDVVPETRRVPLPARWRALLPDAVRPFIMGELGKLSGGRLGAGTSETDKMGECDECECAEGEGEPGAPTEWYVVVGEAAWLWLRSVAVGEMARNAGRELRLSSSMFQSLSATMAASAPAAAREPSAVTSCDWPSVRGEPRRGDSWRLTSSPVAGC